MPIGLQKDTDGIKANHTLASSITRDDDKVETATPTQGVENQHWRTVINVASPFRTIILRSFWDSLRKLKVETFKRDPVLWGGRISMTHSNIADADIFCIAETQEPKNAFTGRAKDALLGYSSCDGEKAHLNRLWKWSMLCDECLHEVCRISNCKTF